MAEFKVTVSRSYRQKRLSSYLLLFISLLYRQNLSKSPTQQSSLNIGTETSCLKTTFSKYLVQRKSQKTIKFQEVDVKVSSKKQSNDIMHVCFP